MFRLLSKETNLFSIPVYIGVALFIILSINIQNIDIENIASNFIAFSGIVLGYVLFNRIGLNRKSHLPLFIYTIFLWAFYPARLDIGIAVTLFTNSILLFFLTDDHPKFRENSYFLIGNILAINVAFLPTIWPLYLFILIHIIVSSDKILANILKLILGIFFTFLGYLCVMYLLDLKIFDERYIPLIYQGFITDFSGLYFLVPIIFFSLIAIADHFFNFNKKSPVSKFKYSFILAFLANQTLILFWYMGHNYEYLLLVIFPISIILSRFLRFLQKPLLQELGLWIIIISCLFSPKLATFFIL